MRIVIILSVLGIILAGTHSVAADGGGFADSGVVGQVASTQTVRVAFTSDDGCLGVVSAGISTRGSAGPTTGGTIQLPAGPASAADIVWAGLYWVILADGPHPNAVTLNGSSVAPASLGVTASPCWSEQFADAYFADVTGLAVPGANVVAGLDDAGNWFSSPDSEGASLVVIYTTEDSGACEIVVTDGNDLVQANGTLRVENPLTLACTAGQQAELTFIGGDGQPYPDTQEWNGVALPGSFDNSDPLVPGAQWGWDTDTYAVSVGAAGNVAALQLGTDCINWIATVVQVGSVDCAVSNESHSWSGVKSLYRP